MSPSSVALGASPAHERSNANKLESGMTDEPGAESHDAEFWPDILARVGEHWGPLITSGLEDAASEPWSGASAFRAAAKF